LSQNYKIISGAPDSYIPFDLAAQLTQRPAAHLHIARDDARMGIDCGGNEISGTGD
jgi:hypothetical protein